MDSSSPLSTMRPGFNPTTLTINTALKKDHTFNVNDINSQRPPSIYVSSPPLRQNPRIRAIKAEEEGRRRKRSFSEEASPLFTENVYEKIDKFMDLEGLDIMSPNRVVKKNTTFLRPCSIFQKQASLDISTLASLNDDEPAGVEKSLKSHTKLAMPKFMIRRAASFGLEDTKNELTSSTIHMKPKACSTLCKVDTQNELKESCTLDELEETKSVGDEN